MILLTKRSEPDVLRLNGAVWLQALLQKIALGQAPTEVESTRYRHPAIKNALIDETNSKCAYCESKILHISFGNIEHIKPKSIDVSGTFRWSNLTLACDKCNSHKGVEQNVVNPYVDDPENHFRFVGPMIYSKPNSSKGIVTEKKLRLNRAELIQDRMKRLGSIVALILLIETTTDNAVKQTLIEDLLTNETSDKEEYAAFARSFIATVASDLGFADGDSVLREHSTG